MTDATDWEEPKHWLSWRLEMRGRAEDFVSLMGGLKYAGHCIVLLLITTACGGRTEEWGEVSPPEGVVVEHPPARLEESHWLSDCESGCDFELLLDFNLPFEQSWNTEQSAAGTLFHSYRAFFDGYLYLTLEEPFRLVRISEEDGSSELLAQHDFAFGKPRITSDGVYWSRYISGGVTTEGVTPVEGVIERVQFGADEVELIFESSLLPAPPIVHGDSIVAVTRDGVMQHPIGSGSWSSRVVFDGEPVPFWPNELYSGHVITWRSDDAPHRLALFELETWIERSVDILPDNDQRSLQTRFEGVTNEFIFFTQTGESEEQGYTQTLLALDPLNGVERTPVRAPDYRTRFRTPQLVNDDLLLLYPDGSVEASSLVLLPRWTEHDLASPDEFLLVEESVQEFFVGDQFLLIVTRDGRLLRRALP